METFIVQLNVYLRHILYIVYMYIFIISFCLYDETRSKILRSFVKGKIKATSLYVFV